eukprot:5686183-Prorocentrum_lima.AAC.1
MTSSLVGSEMCIRDSRVPQRPLLHLHRRLLRRPVGIRPLASPLPSWQMAVSYTHLTLPTICSV